MINFKPNITEADENNISFVGNRFVEVKEYQYGRWETHKNKTFFVPYGSAVYIDIVYIAIDTLEKIMILSFNDAQGRKVTVPFPRKDLTETGILSLLSMGCEVTKKSAGVLIDSILNQEKNARCELIHSSLGFSDYNERKIFLASKAVGVESTYHGKLKIYPNGSLKVWREMIISEVLGTPLEVILAAATAAPLIDYLKEDLHTGNILFSLVGESSSGKTTAGLLAVSLGAKCSFGGDSLVATFGDSINSLMHSLYSSYPFLIDEGSLIRYNPTSLLYSLAEGKEKGRLTKELNKADSMTFSTVVFMTSEKSILRLCDQNTGLLVRCIEFEGVTWTESAESADKIKRVCEDNYGLIIPHIAEKLLELENNGKKGELLERFSIHQKEFIETIRKEGKYNPLTERFSKLISLVLLSGEILAEVLNIQIDKNRIIELIKENAGVCDLETVDIGKRALDYLCQFISRNAYNFVRGGVNDRVPWAQIPSDCKGRITSYKRKIVKNGISTTSEVFMSDMIFQEMLVDGGFPDKKVVLKRWKEEGILHSDTDRYLSNIIIAEAPAVKGYRIYIPIEYEGKITTSSDDPYNKVQAIVKQEPEFSDEELIFDDEEEV